jgi:diguanylate cyclase (GGDEF)-like protein
MDAIMDSDRSNPPLAWPVWSLPRGALAYVLAVEVTALALVTAFAVGPISGTDLLRGAVLAVAAIAHLQISRLTERVRRDHSGTPHVDLGSVWTLPGALLLPPVLEAALIALICTHRWWLVGRHDASRPLFKQLFTAAMMLLSCYAAAGVAHLPGFRLGGSQWVDLAVLVVATLAQFTVNSLLVAGVLGLSTRVRGWRELAGSAGDNLLELAALLLGGCVALLMLTGPALAIVMIVPAVALHRSVLVHQLQLAARTDPKTGLLNASAWHTQAELQLLRTQQQRAGATLGVLMIDLDLFKRVNDTHGHLAGDAVLRAVAHLLGESVRRGDQVGRFGGEEFAVLLAQVTTIADAHAVAERIRARVAALAVDVGTEVPITGLSVSIGVALYPAVDEDSLDGLLAAADAALYNAKRAGRDRVEVAEASPTNVIPAPRQGVPSGAARTRVGNNSLA